MLFLKITLAQNDYMKIRLLEYILRSTAEPTDCQSVGCLSKTKRKMWSAWLVYHLSNFFDLLSTRDIDRPTQFTTGIASSSIRRSSMKKFF